MSKIIFGFIGPAGSGKSTQALLLAESLGASLINVGQGLRDSNNPELKRIMATGELVPDSFVFEIIEQKLKSAPDDGLLVLDGFFRRASEVVLMVKKERALHMQIGAIFDLKLSEATIINRLTKRDRADDTPGAIKKRLEVFLKERDEVLEVIKKEDVKIIEIDAEPEIDAIRNEVFSHLKEFVDKRLG